MLARILFTGVLSALALSCTKSIRNWVRPQGMTAEEAVVSTNAALDELYQQGFESERLDLVNSGLLIKAKFNGHEKKMLLDTGATFSSLGKGKAEMYGLLIGDLADEKDRIVITWLEVLKGNQLALARSFQVAGFEYSPWVFSTHERLHGHPLLGTEYLRFSAAIIFTRFRFLAIHPDGRAARPITRLLESHGYTALAMYGWDFSSNLKVRRKNGVPVKFGVPYVNVTINGKDGRMLIDTGAHMSIIYRDLVSDQARDLYRYQDSYSIDAAGNTQDKFGALLEGVVINKKYHIPEKVIFNAKDITKRREKMKELGLEEDKHDMGALGLDFLVDHNAIIDMGNMMLYLRFR